ncbi:Nramp family divalent metal transporter [Corynebacterium heidelbergense]|uniref:Divalent metal cation transporter n=1 Tax=Corynebacterium heidelbergense TaxID=2055947 RepID=A0A364V567_9CORY|nr:Nramp family divalent metal transporter [Corynebacterium heidelbergense]RAV31761.1 divalent metal cation transporter [Corynebacterium heidelbergense]
MPGAYKAPGLWRLLGPAFVAAIAYVDPGNVAANLTAGARYGYLLVWVLVLANVMAVLFQYLSAKLGIATGRSLASVAADRMGPKTTTAYWMQAQFIAMATDIAEVIGGAIALNLLFGVPLPIGGIIIGAISMAVLQSQQHGGQRTFERIIMAFLAVITIGFVTGLFFSGFSPTQMIGGLVPRLAGTDSLLLATSMLGATIMPHAIYMHSSLINDRFGGSDEHERRKQLLRATRLDVVLALALAGSVNVAMLLLAAASLGGAENTDTIEGAHAAIASGLGGLVATIFAVGLLASGLASASVGAYAGSSVTRDLLRIKIPVWAQRLVTLAPAIIILFLGVEPTWALVMSQVALSLGIPFAAIPLVRATSSPAIMGRLVNSPPIRTIAWVSCAVIVLLNVALVVLTALGEA